MLEKKHREFIDFVIKDWIAEITTETQVTLEFMDRSERSSISSSVSTYDQAEEIEDELEEARPTAYQDRNDLQASYLTSSTERLISNNWIHFKF